MAIISLPYVFSVGATIIASQHNSNFSTIYSDYNGNITDTNISPTAGIEYTKLALNNTIRSTDLLSTTVISVSNLPVGTSSGNIVGVNSNGAPSVYYPYIKISDVKSKNTNGGTATADGSWHTRTLNTTDTDTSSISSLGSNQVTLPTGTYLINASSPMYGGSNAYQTRLQNITSSTTLLLGTSAYVSSGGAGTFSYIKGLFTLASSTALAIQYQIGASNGTYDLGQACNFGNEVYTVAEFTKTG